MTTSIKTESRLTESWIIENIHCVERIALKYAGMLKHSDIGDLVQEALLKVLVVLRERGDSIRGGGYLLRVAERAMIDYIKGGGDDLLGRYYQKQYHDAPHEDVRLFSSPLSGGDREHTLVDILEDEPVLAAPELEYRSLRKALSLLTESEREAVSMRYGLPGYGQYNEPEAAKALNIASSNYSTRVTVGRKKLRNDEVLAKAWKREQAARNKAKRRCLVCHKQLRSKVQIGATGKTPVGETFLCKVCNMTYELNGYGCAVLRSKAPIAPPTGKAELESVLQLNRSVING